MKTDEAFALVERAAVAGVRCPQADDFPEGLSSALMEKFVAQARIAVAYHRLGYSRMAEHQFDPDVLVRLMDQLGELLDEIDEHAASERVEEGK